MAVNYDDRLHRVYARGRELAPRDLQRWIAEFERHAPTRRPLAVLDLGSGIGRFTPALADAFGGPVYGVEPSVRMREIAGTEAAHERVTYVDGSAEAIPLADGSCDLALLFLSLHHFPDQQRAFHELARVIRPGGNVLLRSQFRDRMPDLYWYRYFPSSRQVDADMFPSVAEVQERAVRAGFAVPPTPVPLAVEEPRTLLSLYERLSLRALSTFDLLPAAEMDEGFERFRRDAVAKPDLEVPAVTSDLLVLQKGLASGT